MLGMVCIRMVSTNVGRFSDFVRTLVTKLKSRGIDNRWRFGAISDTHITAIDTGRGSLQLTLSSKLESEKPQIGDYYYLVYYKGFYIRYLIYIVFNLNQKLSNLKLFLKVLWPNFLMVFSNAYKYCNSHPYLNTHNVDKDMVWLGFYLVNTIWCILILWQKIMHPNFRLSSIHLYTCVNIWISKACIWWGADMTPQLVGSYDKGMKHRDGFNCFRHGLRVSLCSLKVLEIWPFQKVIIKVLVVKPSPKVRAS
jgi:hypothetical protein